MDLSSIVAPYCIKDFKAIYQDSFNIIFIVIHTYCKTYQVISQ